MSKNKSFVHLHVHADGSALDGLSQVSKMAPQALALGQTSLAITDHGSMSATYDLYKATKGTALKPIYGIEAYLAPAVPRSHKEPVRWANGGGDDVSGSGAYTHMTMWAETNEGLHNLFRLSSEAYLTGFYRKPRMDEELLKKYHKGIIATTGCPSGEVQTWLRIGNYENAKAAAAKFAAIFGEGNFFVELMDHGLDIEQRVIPELLKIAKELGLPTVATNDSHYTHKEDAHFHEALLCIGSGSKLTDEARFKFDGTGYYLKTAEEMRAIWDHIAPDACDNTVAIAERCVANFEDGHNLMPEFPVPEGETESTWLAKEVKRGLKERYPEGVPEDRVKQAEYEVGVINQMGFPGYFLVTADFIGWAKSDGIRVGPGRGCLSGDSNILTPSGAKKIKEIKAGDYVYDQNGNLVEVPEVFEYDCDESLIHIKTPSSGLGNKMTFDHKVLVAINSATPPVWIRADEVTINDYLVKPLSLQGSSVAEDGAPDFTDKTFRYYKVSETNIVPSEGKVYDFTVPTTNSYVTDSYVVHNSAAGSIVAYAMGITDIDPMKHGLMFERFLNPERVSMPDIDVDFDDRKRGRVIDYVIQKYGEDKVANITTFMSVKAKAAIKDASRVLGMPYLLGDALTKVYPQPIVGRDLSLSDAYDPSHERYDEAAEFRKLAESTPDHKEIVKLAKGLEGVRRGHGMHAAGVIMSRKPLVETVPLMRRDTNSPVMTQFEYPTCEYLGLLKMDFLGLSNLGTLDEALRLVEQNRGIAVDLKKIGEDLNDTQTFEMLARGETLGVFQLDSPPMRSLLKLMEPDQFEDISAVLALYRPGPMGAGSHIEYAERKNGRRKNTPIHPELEEALVDILGETHGLIVYQEQVMKVAQDLAGYSLGKADLLRRAMGKKDPKILAQEFTPFRDGMRANGYSDGAIQSLWDVLVPFSDYAFNRAHTAGYGLVSYWTAYLKANFPAEYMAALLTTNADNKDKLALYLGECRRMGIKVLSPDVNQSELNYTAVGEDIRVGLVGVKNIGEKVVNAWLDIKKEKGKASTFADFLMKADGSLATKRSLESIIKAGALDSFGHTRSSLFLIVEDALKLSKKAIKNAEKKEVTLFEDDELEFQLEIPEIEEWEKTEKLTLEREMLGLYVSDHPLGEYANAISMLSSLSIADLRDAEHPPTDTIKLAGLVSAIDRKTTKKSGEPWALVTIEDLDSSINVFVFPKTYAEYSDLLKRDAVLVFTGKAEKRDDGSTSVIIRDISEPNLTLAQRKAERRAERVASGEITEAEAKAMPVARAAVDAGNTNPIVIAIEEQQLDLKRTTMLKDLLLEYTGSRPVHIRMKRIDGTFGTFILAAEYNATGTGELAAEIRALFGAEAV